MDTGTPVEFPSSIPCQIGGDMRLLYRLPRIWTQKTGRAFAIYWSDKWGHGRLYPTPTDQELEAFYHVGNYDQYMQGITGARVSHKSLLDRLLDPLIFRTVARLGEGEKLAADFVRRRVPPPARVLDVGSGPGLMLAELAPIGYEVAGVDPNPVALASARKRGIRMYDGLAETMPDDVPRDYFDIVTLSQTLEHTRDPALALCKSMACLKPGGLLVVEVPNFGSAGFSIHGPAWYHTDAGRHVNLFTKRSLDAYFRHVGLEPIEHGFGGVSHQFARMEDEQEVWDALYGSAPVKAARPRPSPRSRLSLFLRVLRGTDETRRDMVWMVGRKRS